MGERIGVRIIRFMYKKADYPIGIQLGAIAVMLGFAGLLYFLKNRFLPVAILILDAAGKI